MEKEAKNAHTFRTELRRWRRRWLEARKPEFVRRNFSCIQLQGDATIIRFRRALKPSERFVHHVLDLISRLLCSMALLFSICFRLHHPMCVGVLLLLFLPFFFVLSVFRVVFLFAPHFPWHIYSDSGFNISFATSCLIPCRLNRRTVATHQTWRDECTRARAPQQQFHSKILTGKMAHKNWQSYVHHMHLFIDDGKISV